MSKKIIFFLLFLNVVTFSFVYELSSGNELQVIFFDVGQGDSIFIETPQKHQIIIDSGPGNKTLLEKVSSVMPFGDKTIDLIILTHTDSDHISGFFELLDNYVVENILWSGISGTSSKSEKWEAMIEVEGANIFYSNEINKIILGDVVMDIISPNEYIIEKYSKNANDISVVSKMIYKNSSFLFTGDITNKLEKEIVNEDIFADVLKVSHHGSKHSTCEEFVVKVDPLIAVIQVGKNSYGHPADDVLTRLSNFGIKVLRNDIDGDIKISTDGNNYKIITNKK
ncbi:MAG: MBL fold metallo-hydrolase [Candidatus Pacebacteria bacterium]|nr:MBL fold metallo-hydrolase [Candidatus Paceibacterota bacterium]MDD2756986.1 MBL fold metallo-hydrolase [Candidatus Paceibacterota bacterium]MDD3283496.1 MBL fold metallo-hydrolase [Candidatus Paceibacterota bacterium]MDD3969648.1 MBL fold metallo-hydrolase [Candidatus Paceibacterota bacterium]MDD4737878.1 MBL fold metallo-hydrolase [Candidatus Paceibacterota bacterium]